MRKKEVIAVALSILRFTLWVPAQAQHPNKIARIGYLAVSNEASHAPRVAGLRQGLRELGYIEGRNILIEYRYAGGSSARLSELAAELVRLKVEAIVTTGSEGAFAAKRATSTIPIITTTGDHLATGLIANLARPGGNITGLTNVASDLSGKHLELLKETVPRVVRLGALWIPSDPGPATVFKAMEGTAPAFGLQIQSLEVREAKDFDAAFKTATGARVQALIVLGGSLINIHRRRIVQFAIQSQLPTMLPQVADVEAGGLMSYGPNAPDLYRRAATYVDKILKGADPAELPVQQPTKFDLVINMKTAKQIGLTIPPNVLARADRVIK
jgi:putative ABC transport system substrate-binding protein